MKLRPYGGIEMCLYVIIIISSSIIKNLWMDGFQWKVNQRDSSLGFTLG